MSDWQEERRRRDRARREEVMRLPVLPVRRHGVIDGRDGEVRVCAPAGPAGEVVAVWTTPEGLEALTSRTVQPGRASFPDPAAARPVAARITVRAPELAAVTRIADLARGHCADARQVLSDLDALGVDYGEVTESTVALSLPGCLDAGIMEGPDAC
jgi:hypothetical protein